MKMNNRKSLIFTLCIVIGTMLNAQNIQGPVKCKTCGKLLKECPYNGKHEKDKEILKAKAHQHIAKAKYYYQQGDYSKAMDEIINETPYYSSNWEACEILGDIEYYYYNPFITKSWYNHYQDALDLGRLDVKEKLLFDIRLANYNYRDCSSEKESEIINCEATYTEDASERFRLFKKASEMGSQRASFNLGRMYEVGKETKQDYKEAFRLFESSKDFAPSALHLAWLYRHGLGVEKNETKSFEIYSSLIDKTKNDIRSNTYALYNTAVCYESGVGVEKNLNKAFEYYRLIMDNNPIDNGNERCIELATIRYSELAHDNIIDTIPPTGNYYMNLYHYYYSTFYTIYHQKKYKQTEKQKKALAESCIKNAAQYDITDKDWQNSIGNHFKAKKSYYEAIKWYRKGAQNGASTSCWNLGYCYENGLGVEQDYEEAMRWYVKAKEHGNYGADAAIERLKKKGY